MLPSHLYVFSDATMIMFKKNQNNQTALEIIFFLFSGRLQGKTNKTTKQSKKPQNKQTKTQ